MRQNNHILNRNNYQNSSSFKIRQPLNDESYHQRSNYRIQEIKRSGYRDQHQHQQDKYKHVNNQYQNLSRDKSMSNFYNNNPHMHNTSIQPRENSRQMSYNSRQSNNNNGMRKSIKMTDYVALQAKNLIENKDKFKYDNHIRSSSMHCYPSSFKMSKDKENKQKHYQYRYNRNQNNNHTTATEIPSFGIQCRSTVSGGGCADNYNHRENNYEKASSLNKYTLNSYKLDHTPSSSLTYVQRKHQTRQHLRTQIDQRIQRMRTSSKSSRHGERLNHIKAIDNNRLQNMDKINIKIKNILTTLQQEENHYRQKFSQANFYHPGSNIKTESLSSAYIDERCRNRGFGQQDMQKSASNYKRPMNSYHQENNKNSKVSKSFQKYSGANCKNSQNNSIYYEEPSYVNLNISEVKNLQNHVSSYYYYEDQSAILKSSQSPFKQTPERSFKRNSVEKNPYSRQKNEFIKNESSEKYQPLEKNQKRQFNDQRYYQPSQHKQSQPRRQNLSLQDQVNQRYPQRDEYKTLSLQKSVQAIKRQINPINLNLLKNINQSETQIIDSNSLSVKQQNPYYYQNIDRSKQNQRYEKANQAFVIENDQISSPLKYSNYKTPYLANYHDIQNQKLSSLKCQQQNKFNQKNKVYTNSNLPYTKYNECVNNYKNKAIQQQQQINSQNKSVTKKNLIYFNQNKQIIAQKQDQHRLRSIGRDQSSRRQALSNRIGKQYIANQKEIQNELIQASGKNYFEQISNYQKRIKNQQQGRHSSNLKKISQENYYSDSIKQTPCIKKNQNLNVQRNQARNNLKDSPIRNKNISTQNNPMLDNKLKQYEQRMRKYEQQMRKSDVFSPQNQKQSDRSNKSNRHRNQQSKLKKQKLNQINSPQNLKINDAVIKSQQNVERLLYQIRNQRVQRQQKEIQQVSSREVSWRNTRQPERQNNRLNYNDSRKNSEKNMPKSLVISYNSKYVNRAQNKPFFQQKSSSRKYSPKRNNRINDPNQNLIENLKRQRSEALNLNSRRKSTLFSTSIDYSRLKTSPIRSQSQTSRISAVTIVKGKNIDEEITKIQQKMQSYQKLKKQLNLQSQQNTQRSIIHEQKSKPFKQAIKNLVTSPSKRIQQPEYKSPNTQNNQDNKYKQSSNHRNQPNNNTSHISATQLLKTLTQDNSYVKIRKSILKQHATNQIKSYLDEQIQISNHNSRSGSVNQKKQYPQATTTTTKMRYSASKQNVLPLTTTTIQSPKYSNGAKKVVLGLAQNLIINCIETIQSNGVISQTDVNTPKLLRNLKNKNNDKSRIKKKNDKRGFRSQFINNLHQDNQILSSANKKQLNQQINDQYLAQTNRCSPQNKQTLLYILNLIQNQIIIDEKFRNQKKWFNSLTKKDKWSALMGEYLRMVSNSRNILLSEIVNIFTLTQQQNNPFYSTRGVSSTLESLIESYLESQNNWKTLRKQLSQVSLERFVTCGFSQKNLDIEQKGFIEIQDLTRFINMELNKYYRKRDLWIVWKRISNCNLKSTKSHNNQSIDSVKLVYEDLVRGLTASK